MMDFEHEVIFCIVNEGFSEVVMEAARRAGARGGTVLRARGTANVEAEKVFGISVSPQKEIVMILVPAEIRNDILHSLYSTCGLDTPGHGIAFALPVDAVVGIKNWKPAPAPAEAGEEAQSEEEKNR
ncbi:MAG: P-II family nitrogen regulator [Clostridia bacterium]|nr:P-II family nitrogen regulator [Clostridia bacterium]